MTMVRPVKGRRASRRRPQQRWGWATHAQSHGPPLLWSKRMGAHRLALVWRVWALAQHAQPFGCDLVSVASAYKPPSSNHLQRGLHTANGATSAGVVDPTSSGNEVSVELSLTQRSDPRLFHHHTSASEMKVPIPAAHVATRAAYVAPVSVPCITNLSRRRDTWVKDGLQPRSNIGPRVRFPLGRCVPPSGRPRSVQTLGRSPVAP
jgi:hypothetical protein